MIVAIANHAALTSIDNSIETEILSVEAIANMIFDACGAIVARTVARGVAMIDFVEVTAAGAYCVRATRFVIASDRDVSVGIAIVGARSQNID
jgi:hypothetical protein